MKRLTACLLLAAALPVMAQLFDSEKQSNGPIKITSDVMDVDMEKKITVFTGNVLVVDEQVTITCTKMILYGANEKGQKKDQKKDQKKEKRRDGSLGSTELEKIECFGSADNPVVIHRRPPKDQKNPKDEWGTCGRAVYYHTVDKGVITMYDEPVLYQDDSRITGETLNLYNGSKRFTGTMIKLNARIKAEEEKDARKANKKQPEKRSTAGKKPAEELTQKEKDKILGL